MLKSIDDYKYCIRCRNMILNAFDFLIKNKQYVNVSELPNSPNMNTWEQLALCIDKLNRINADVISINVTASDIHSLGLYTGSCYSN